MRKIEESLYKSLLKIYPYVVRDLTKKITTDIEKQYKNVISQFYRNYEPSRYLRQGNPFHQEQGLYDGLQIKKQHGIIHYETNYKNLTGRYRSASDAFNRAYSKGIHGDLRYVPDYTMNPHPENIFDKAMENYNCKDDVKKIFHKYIR